MTPALAIILTSTGFILFYILAVRKYLDVLVAAGITLAWVGLSGIYNYRDTNLSFLGINLFAFTAWTAGLLLLKWAYDGMRKNKLSKAILGYLISVVMLEYIGYNILKIKLASNYPGFMGFELMHAPKFSQYYYLSIGIIYILLFYILENHNLFNSKKKHQD